MVSSKADVVGVGDFLTTVNTSGGDVERASLLVKSILSPETTGSVEESGDLSWTVTVSGWETEDKTVVLSELVHVLQDWNVRTQVLWCAHLGENLIGESLLDSVTVDLNARLLKTLVDRVTEGEDVRVGAVFDLSDFNHYELLKSVC